MRLTLVIYSLSAGGAERVMSIMANYWAEKGWSITLLTFDDGSKKPFYNLHPSVTHRPLGAARKSSNVLLGLINNINLFFVLRKAIKKSDPQAVIAFTSRVNVQVLLATFALKIPIIISERSVPSHRQIGKIWSWLRRRFYAYCSCLVVQSQGVRAFFSDIEKLKMQVIPNPVIPFNSGESVLESEKSKSANKIVLAMGRLTEQKGFDLLLRAFAQIAQKNSDWFVEVWGEGPQRADLENLRDELGLHDRVRFPGLTQSSAKEMRRADLFVLTSRWEGFPNVICEAMVCGTPVISFNCPHGPREIIGHNIGGILVPENDVEALRASMESLMGDEEERDRMSAGAPEVVKRFELTKVMGMWEDVVKASLEDSTNEQKN